MQRFITIQQTPTYRFNGSTYTPVGSLPVGTELDFVTIAKNSAGREVGTLANGMRMFIDTLAPLLEDKVTVKASRLYLGLWALAAAFVGYKGYQYYKKKNKD